MIKSLFFMLSTWYCTWCSMIFFLLITLFPHPLQIFSNVFPLFMHVPTQDVSLLFSIVYDILYMFQHMVFFKFLYDRNLLPHSVHVCHLVFYEFPPKYHFFTFSRQTGFDILCMLHHLMFMNFSKIKIVFLHSPHACVLVFRKMFFMIHFIFTFLAGKIYWPLFTTFYPLFVIIFHEKITFFHVKHMVLHLMFDEFLSPHYTFFACTTILW